MNLRNLIIAAAGVVGIAATLIATRAPKEIKYLQSAREKSQQVYIDQIASGFQVPSYVKLVYDQTRELIRADKRRIGEFEGMIRLYQDHYDLSFQRRPWKQGELEEHCKPGPQMGTSFDMMAFAQQAPSTIFIFPEAFNLFPGFSNCQREHYCSINFKSGLAHELQHARDAHEGFRLGDGFFDNETAKILYLAQMFGPIMEMRGHAVQIKFFKNPSDMSEGIPTRYKKHHSYLVERVKELPPLFGNKPVKKWVEQFLAEHEHDPVLGKFLN